MPRKAGSPYRIDLSGQIFSYWLVIGRVKGSTWLCRCKCGKEKILHGSGLKLGKSRSCGCAKLGAIHGMEGSRIYNTWAQMLGRCNNPNARSYKYYGAKGIKVCERWLNFVNFYADMGDIPEGKTLDRWPNKSGDYEPSNCRWATGKEQNRNKSNSKLHLWNGKMVTAAEAAEGAGIGRKKVESRLRNGMTMAEALASDRYNRWTSPLRKP